MYLKIEEKIVASYRQLSDYLVINASFTDAVYEAIFDLTGKMINKLHLIKLVREGNYYRREISKDILDEGWLFLDQSQNDGVTDHEVYRMKNRIIENLRDEQIESEKILNEYNIINNNLIKFREKIVILSKKKLFSMCSQVRT